uniref:uncharacterized protein At2g34160-like isoform X1 n=1 Tax=Fragaria vesca subsp. vesca TaxID=101020 RepID=UPI0005CAAB11|nr:PREDICTED: uncharacterized protein At2g34160-like isoform X1 [Fragaria vesca subsp. vesca]
MEGLTEAVNDMHVTESAANKKNHRLQNRIQVSNTKKPLFFYVNLAKKYMQLNNEVELSGLGMGTLLFFPFNFWISNHLFMELGATLTLCCGFVSTAIATVVTIAEILKNNGLAVEKKIITKTVDMREDAGGRPIQKAKIEILLGKSDKFDEILAAAAEEANEYEDQS